MCNLQVAPATSLSNVTLRYRDGRLALDDYVEHRLLVGLRQGREPRQPGNPGGRSARRGCPARGHKQAHGGEHSEARHTQPPVSAHGWILSGARGTV